MKSQSEVKISLDEIVKCRDVYEIISILMARFFDDDQKMKRDVMTALDISISAAKEVAKLHEDVASFFSAQRRRG